MRYVETRIDEEQNESIIAKHMAAHVDPRIAKKEDVRKSCARAVGIRCETPIARASDSQIVNNVLKLLFSLAGVYVSEQNTRFKNAQ